MWNKIIKVVCEFRLVSDNFLLIIKVRVKTTRFWQIRLFLLQLKKISFRQQTNQICVTIVVIWRKYYGNRRLVWNDEWQGQIWKYREARQRPSQQYQQTQQQWNYTKRQDAGSIVGGKGCAHFVDVRKIQQLQNGLSGSGSDVWMGAV